MNTWQIVKNNQFAISLRICLGSWCLEIFLGTNLSGEIITKALDIRTVVTLGPRGLP